MKKKFDGHDSLCQGKPAHIKTENITVRISPHLKRQVHVACEYMGTSLTDVINSALRKFLLEYQERFTKDTNFARIHCQGMIAQAAYEFLVRYTEMRNKQGESLVIPEHVKKILWDMGQE